MNCYSIRLRVYAESFEFPLLSSSSHRVKISWIMLKLDISFYLTSIPIFLRSLAIFYLLNNSEQLSVKNYITPLLSKKSPYYPLFFLLVDELKHLSYIYLTYIFWSLFRRFFVFFYNYVRWRYTYLCIYDLRLSINHYINPVLYFCVWMWFWCFDMKVFVRNSFYRLSIIL